jgi:hypothetical protein
MEKEKFMGKAVKIALLALAAVAATAAVLFVVVPLATSKEAEARLSEALAEVGIPGDMWSIGRAYYIPVLGHLVVEKLEFGEKGFDFLEAKKVTLALDTGREDLFMGSVNARDVSFSSTDNNITIKNISVNDFSVDKALFGYSPAAAVKKLGNIYLSEVVFIQQGRTYFSLGTFSANADYTEGEIPFSSSVSLKKFAMDIRPFTPFSSLRPEYRLSNLELKNSLSGGIYMINLVIDGANLFTIKTNLGIALPHEILASGKITDLALIDFEEDIKLASFALAYTDKSFLNHVFEFSGMSGSRESVAEQLNEIIMMSTATGGADAEAFAGEVTKFIANPGKFELKTNSDSPVNFEDISRNPTALNVSLSVNGGKPLTMGGR